MFGYVRADAARLAQDEKPRYEAYYCGLCRALQKRGGPIGAMTLSYDMAFLWMVLSGLYEPQERIVPARCPFHPFRRRAQMCNDIGAYAADMNILLAYHKARDDRQDEGGLRALAGEWALRRAYRRVEARYPAKCEAVSACMERIAALEKAEQTAPDELANLTGAMLGEIYAYRQDVWARPLRRMGEALGRFVYYMDAYDDYEEDAQKGRFNPLRRLDGWEERPELIRGVLRLMMAQCAQAFEELPILRDAGMIRNVLYAGVWQRYDAIQAQREKERKGDEQGSVRCAGRCAQCHRRGNQARLP